MGFFFTSHQTNTTLGPEQKLGIPLLVLPFPRLGQPSHFPLSSPLQDPTWPPQPLEQHRRKMNCGSMGLGSMVPRDEGLGLPGEQQLSQWPQPGTLEPAWLSLWGCPCSRHFLKPSGRCFKSKHCKTLPGLPLGSRGEKREYPGKLFWSRMRLKWKISAELISAGGVKGGEAQLPLALQHGRTDGRTAP